MKKTIILLLVLSTLLVLAASTVSLAAPGAPAICNAGDVGGTVYREVPMNGTTLNTYGVKNANEPGVGGVLVTVTDVNGAVQTYTSDANGAWAVHPAASPVRVEFTVPDGLFAGPDGADSKTSVQFASATDCGVDMGVHYPGDFSSTANPMVAIPRQENGLASGNTDPAIFSLDYDENGNYGEETGGPHDWTGYVDATTEEIGSTWGLAYQRAQQRMFVSALLKRHSGLANGLDAIYVLDYSTTPATVTSHFNLQGVSGIDLGSVTRSGGSDYTLPTGDATPSVDLDAFAKVAKVGFGDIDLSDDENTLWAVNLKQRALISIDVSGATVPGAVSQTLIGSLPGVPSCSGGALRPWALKFYQGKGYLGMVCDAQASQSRDDMIAYVHSFDPANLGAGLTQELTFSLKYDRETDISHPERMYFQPWLDDWATVATHFSYTDEYAYAQALLSDIEFTPDGDMYLGFTDRWGNQAGWFNSRAIAGDTSTNVRAKGWGELLRVCNLNGVWMVEGSDPSCPTHYNTSTSTGVNGNGEYFDDTGGDRKQETTLGALAMLAGSGQLLTSMSNPFPGNSSIPSDHQYWANNGLEWFTLVDGAPDRYIQVDPTYETGCWPDRSCGFGKANGVGDVELLLDPAPLEIGNRLWCDTGAGVHAGNGVQDPGEVPVAAGVTVTLECDTNGSPSSFEVSANTTTNGSGNYLFRDGDASLFSFPSASWDSSIHIIPRWSSCRIRINPAQSGISSACGSGAQPTTANNGGANPGSDLRDSDGIDNIDGAGNVGVILTTGGSGQNDHSYDFGFDERPTYSLGDLVWYDQDQDGVQDAGELGVQNITATLHNNGSCSSSTGQTDVTDGSGIYGFADLVAGTYSVQFSGISSGWHISAANQGGDDTADSDANTSACIQNISLTADDPDEDMGIYQDAEINGHLYLDTNGDGDQDAGEPDLADVDVVITDSNGNHQTVSTDASGDYTATVPPGDTITNIDETDPQYPTGYTQTEGTDPTTTTAVAGTNTFTENDGFYLPVDWGDAPTAAQSGFAGSYPTTLADNGARHIIGGPFMGAAVDDEINGQPTAAAIGDDLNGTPDDEDGVTFTTPLMPDATVGVDVDLSNSSACTLNAWMDFNRDGDWADSGEQIFTNQALTGGQINSLTFPVPAGAAIGDTYSRFRCSTHRGLSYTGEASDGEVEDLLALIDERPTYSLGDLVWYDQDQDGVQDAGEPGVSGVTATLHDNGVCSSPTGQTDVTNANGNYGFSGLAAGEYSVRFSDIPSGWSISPQNQGGDDSKDSDARNDVTHWGCIEHINLTADDPDEDMGIIRPGAIGDFVWYDTDADGIEDVGEPGIPNVAVDLYRDSNSSGALEIGVDQLVASTQTDADGGYLFPKLEPAVYFVDVTDAANPNGDLNGLTHIVANQSMNDPAGPINLTAGEVYKDADFGYVREPGGGNVIIGDTVWYDGNGDGVQQPWEPGIPSIEIKATNSTGGSHTATTDGNGHYLIEAPQGSYTMSPVNPPAYLIPTTPETVGPTIILAGEQFLDADFGYRVSQPGMIGNLVWEDANKDGDYDGGESPLAGVSVDLIRDANQNGVWDAGDLIIATTTTKSTMDANNGNYLFEGLPSDRYLVHVSDTNAVLVDYVKSVLGAAGANNNNQADPYAIALPAGGQNLTADFGYVKIDVPNTGVIGNQVWIETASNGLYDPAEGDVGQAGVTVALHKDGNPYATTTTGASGGYSFTSLPSGDYTVQVTDDHGVLANYASTVLGPNPGADNNNQAQPYAITLPAAGVNLTADFGYVGGGGLQADSTIGNLVWLDIDGDGFYDTASEPGIGNVSVELLYDTNKNGVVDGGDISIGTALTSATVTLGGNYLFEGEFRPGDYLVRVTDENNVLTPYTQTVGANQNDDNFSKTQPYAIEDFNPTGAGNDIDLTSDFGYEPPPSNYTIEKSLTSGSPARPNEEVTFDITITNTGDTWLAVAPMKDEYDTEYLTYGYQGQFASQNSDDNTNDGTINWSDLTVSFGQDLEPLHSFVVTVHFTAVKDTTALPNETTVNTATVTNAWADPDGPDGPLGSDIPLPEKSDDAEIKIVNPTGLELSSFAAEVQGGGVRVSWETYLELVMLGFNVQRSVAGGDFETLNAELIIAEHAGSSGGGAYEYMDETTRSGETYQYRLEIIKLDGSSVVYGLSKVAVLGLRPSFPSFIY